MVTNLNLSLTFLGHPFCTNFEMLTRIGSSAVATCTSESVTVESEIWAVKNKITSSN